MTTYRISQLAEHVGVPATTLRFYEREGLLPAARSPSGYRQYTDLDREKVRFITAAEHLVPARSGRCDAQCSFPPDLPGPDAVPIACSLDGAAYADRIEEWRRLLTGAEIARLADGGRAVRLPVDRADRLVALVVAEQRCCPFLSFRLTFDGAHVELVAHAPDDAEMLFRALFDGEACPC